MSPLPVQSAAPPAVQPVASPEHVVQDKMQQAVSLHQSGQLGQAVAGYEQILASDPQHFGALNMLGVAMHQLGQSDRAISLIKQALQVKSDYVGALGNLGKIYDDLGQMELAIDAYDQALVLKPDLADVLVNKSALQHALKDYAGALISAQRAIELRQDLPQAFNNRGNAQRALGQIQQAIQSYDAALALDPAYVDALCNRGSALQADGQSQLALESFDRAISVDPNFAAAHVCRGDVLRELEQWQGALTSYERALRLRPEDAITHVNCGVTLQSLRRPSDAVAAFDRALQLDERLVEAHYNRGVSLNELKRLEEALAAYDRVIALRPDSVQAHANRGHVLNDLGRHRECVAALRHALTLNPDDALTHANLVYAMMYQADFSAADILAEAQRWDQMHARKHGLQIAPHTNSVDPERRLRIGYVSPDFWGGHCQALFSVPLLTHHDADAFEIFVYSHTGQSDNVTALLQRHVAHWCDTRALSDDQLAQRIRDDQIDILVDLTLFMANGRPLLFARKPAPVQVAWLAYPGTTGLSAMDYRLTDPYLDPPGENDDLYSEKSLRLPDTFWCYDPLTSEIDPGPVPASVNGYVTFGCLNNFCKVSDDTLRLWGRVMSSVPRSRLLLLAPAGQHRRRATDLLGEYGIEADRVEFVEFVPRSQYLEYYRRLDVCLDTFPYNGHTTSLDAFWMGVPVVTKRGHTIAGRAGWSQLNNLGLTELHAEDENGFVQCAVELAGNLVHLQELRSGLRARMRASPLMDGARFAVGIEAAFRQMWRQWCASRVTA
ncbi:MAG: tetratricopeptide repeat protein [Burkholderiales bacterium]|nr:tetratricopeptide repeat protein [Burkholderiales bacterium]